MRTKMMTWLWVLVFVAALAQPGLATASELRQYTVLDLGTLGGTFSLAGGINNRGEVEGFSLLSGDEIFRGFLWRNGVMIDLGTLGGPSSFAVWRPSNRGQVGGTAETSTPDPLGEDFCGFGTNLVCRAFVWHEGAMTPLELLGGNNANANGFNDRNWVAGVAETETPEPTCEAPQVLQFAPVIWENGEIEELPRFGDDPAGQANAINNRGQVIGFSGDCSVPVRRHALLWQRNGTSGQWTVTDLGSFGNIRPNEAIDINDRGQIVGTLGVTEEPFVIHGFLWENGSLTDIGTLPGDTSSFGIGINNQGQVVGSSCDSDFNCRAILWQRGVMTDLNTLIPADSPLFLIEATGTINDRGQIAGYALHNDSGEIHAFLITPSGNREDDASPALAALSATAGGSSVTLPADVREMLRERLTSDRPGSMLLKRR